MKSLLFVWLIMFYLTRLTMSDDSGDDDGDGDGDNCSNNIDEDRCPCFPGYIDDILGRCSDLFDGFDEEIGCRITADSIIFGRDRLVCGEDFIPPFLLPIFSTGDFVCINGNIIEIIAAILNFIREAFEELSDILDEICDDDRRRMLTDTSTNSGFTALLELLQFRASSITGAEGASERDRLFAMLMGEGGLMSAVQSLRKLQIAREQELFESPETTAATARRLLDDDDDDDDGSGFCPFEFLGIALGGGDDDDNIFAVILEELEEFLDDDCDEEEFFFTPVRCILGELLNGDDDDDDDGNGRRGCGQVIAVYENADQARACDQQLSLAAFALDSTAGCEGDNPCGLSGADDVPASDQICI